MPKLNATAAARREARGNSTYFVEALARGLEVIRAFGRERAPMTLSEVARRTGLSKPTARRMLLTLCDTGYFGTDGNAFWPAPGVLSLATAYLGTDLVVSVLQPTCERLMAATEESCFVAVLDGMDIVMIANAHTSFPTGLHPTIGLRRPALATAAGRVMLGTLSDADLNRHLNAARPKRSTEFTETDKSRLREIIVRTREDGYAITRQELSLGYCGVAVPLRKIDRQLLGALCIIARVERYDATPKLGDKLVDLLRREAAALSTQLV
jgi:IclR family pca regulon transcriptional regulator